MNLNIALNFALSGKDQGWCYSPNAIYHKFPFNPVLIEWLP